jgi:hypothetical protein
MKESYWGYWLILLGVFIIVVMMFTQDATTSTTQDYYQLKEVANSAIYDSIDYAYYSQTKQIRMIKEIFVENFVRRFAETAAMTDTYRIDFYDLYESPPKVSVKVTSNTGNYNIANDSTATDIVNSIDIVVEFDSASNVINTEDSGCEYYRTNS